MEALFDAWRQARVLVFGDVMLDRYTWGTIERISPEAPVPILRVDKEESRPGGAACTAAFARSLGAAVTCAGFVGEDAAARHLYRLLVDAGIAPLLLRTRDRSTTTKDRFLGSAPSRSQQQLLRVDRETTCAVSSDASQRLVECLQDILSDHGAILVSDYGKGSIDGTVGRLVSEARRRSIPVLVDPAHGRPLDAYSGAQLLKFNRAEAEAIAGRPIRSSGDALAFARSARTDYDFHAVVVTLDRDGMVFDSVDGCGEIPPTRLREVVDITGAGDMVLAVLGLCLATGTSLPVAMDIANAAAGLEVERMGVSPVSPAELAAALSQSTARRAPKVLSVDELGCVVDCARCDGKRIVFTNGCFDVLHSGHVAYLEEAACLGDLLVVAVNDDASVRRLKGAGRPINPVDERVRVVAGLEAVDYLVVFDEDTPHHLLRRIRPDLLVKGGDYHQNNIVCREIVEEYGGEVRALRLVPDLSSTKVAQRCRQALVTDVSQEAPTPR